MQKSRKICSRIRKAKTKKERQGITFECIKELQEKELSELNELKNRIENLKNQKISKKKIESLELKLEGEKIYQRAFIKDLDKILKHEFLSKSKEKIILKETVENYLKRFSAPEFSDLSSTEKANLQEEFLQKLVSQISKIPHGTWSINFKRAIETGKMNCSCCSALTGLILESTQKITGIKNIEYGFPVDHAVNIVTLVNEKTFLVDSRKGIVEELTNENSEIEKYNDLKIYKIKERKGERIYQIIPVLTLKEGIIISYLGDLCGAYFLFTGKFLEMVRKEKEEFKEEWEVLKKLPKENLEELFKEEELSEEKSQFLMKIRKAFAGNLDNYEKTNDFKEEKKQIREIYYKKKTKNQKFEKSS
jgi:hypothetical protein